MQYSKISTAEAIVLILSIVIAHTVLSLSRELVMQSKSAAILNIFFVGLVALTLVFLIYKLLSHFPGQDILDVSRFLGGGIFQKIMGLLFIAYFMITASIMLRSFCEALKIVYYPMTNITFLLLFFVIAIGIVNRLNFHASLKTTLIIIPMVLVSIIFMFVTSFEDFTPEKMFPILGDGFVNTFVLGLTNLYAFGGMICIYFLPPLLKKPEKFKKVCLLSTIITFLYILLSVAIILFIFSSFIQTNEIMPLYSIARYIELGSFFQRLESVFLLLWMMAFACYLTIASKLSMMAFQRISNIKDTKPMAYIFSLLMLSIALAPNDYATIKYYEQNLYPYIVLRFYFFTMFRYSAFSLLEEKEKESR